MNQLLQSEYLVLVLAFLIGLIVGYIILRPLFLFFKRKAGRKNLPYTGVLMNSFAKISWLIGIGILLNLLKLEAVGLLKSNVLQKAIQVVSIIILTYIVAEILVFVYNQYSKSIKSEATSLYHILIRLLVYSSGLMVIFDVLGIEIAPILTALGVGGLAVALALQDTLSNLFAGVHILAAKQLKPGDYIKLDTGEEGYVVDINWRNTEIKTLLENIVIIPNSKISSSVTTNYFTFQKNAYFHVAVGVHYDSDLDQVEKITLEVAQQLAKETPDIPDTFEPRVRFFEFADSSINIKVWLATDLYENQFAIKHEFIKRLKKRYDEESIVIPFPIRTVYMEQGNK
jgi:small-conductance mechanosensitive channel